MRTALRGLRLNCWLAGLLPALAAAVAVAVLWTAADRRITEAARDGLAQSVAAYAAIVPRPPLTALAADHRFTAFMRAGLREERLTVLESTPGAPALPVDDIPAQLITAVLAPTAFEHRGHVVAAAGERDPDGQVRLLIAWAEAPAGLDPLSPLACIAAALLAGMAIAWYLGRRVWRPVEALGREADAAMRDEPGVVVPQAEEIESVASSVRTLATAYRDLHRRHGGSSGGRGAS